MKLLSIDVGMKHVIMIITKLLLDHLKLYIVHVEGQIVFTKAMKKNSHMLVKVSGRTSVKI